MKGIVLVTGATGNVGRAATAELLARGAEVRVAARDPGTLQQQFPECEATRLDYEKPDTFGPAVHGAAALLLIRPPAIAHAKRTLNALIDEAVRQGTRHIVFSSVAGADRNPRVPHHRVETHLQRCPVGWTILRPGFFSQNLADAYRLDIVEDDRILLPSGAARVAFIDTRDIGEVAARVLTKPGEHSGTAYHLTGPAAVTFDDVAAHLTAALGRRIRYEPCSPLRYAFHLRRRRRLGPTQIAVQTLLHAGLPRGDAEPVDPTLSRLLDRPARPIESYIREHVAVWRP